MNIYFIKKLIFLQLEEKLPDEKEFPGQMGGEAPQGVVCLQTMKAKAGTSQHMVFATGKNGPKNLNIL